jgi:methionyl-tRNA formyltransferase
MKVNKQKDLKILFIGKADDFYSRQAADFVLTHYPAAEIIFSERQQPFPEELHSWTGDLIISYLSQWIIPEMLLEKASMAALNFHPGPPEYPGIGCTNFAIYDNVDEFGVTCHHMAARVDTGKIIRVKRFPVYETDTVYSITQQCYSDILNLFHEIFSLVIDGKNIPVSNEEWKRKPYLRKELDDLCRLTPDMDIDEIERRIKATHYIQPWAFMQVGNKTIKLSEEDIKTRGYLAYLSQPNLS